MKRGEDLFFFFYFFFGFSLLKMTEICFGSTKMGIFYWEKAFHARKKIRKNDFAPSAKYACYAPVLLTLLTTISHITTIFEYLQEPYSTFCFLGKKTWSTGSCRNKTSRTAAPGAAAS